MATMTIIPGKPGKAASKPNPKEESVHVVRDRNNPKLVTVYRGSNSFDRARTYAETNPALYVENKQRIQVWPAKFDFGRKLQEALSK